MTPVGTRHSAAVAVVLPAPQVASGSDSAESLLAGRPGVGTPVDLTAVASPAAALARAAEVVRAADAPVVLLDAAVRCHATPVADLLDDPRRATAVSIVADGAGSPVRLAGGEVDDAGSAVHPVAGAQSRAPGLVRIDRADAPRAADAMATMADAAARHGWSVRAFDLAMVALVRGAVRVQAVAVEPFVMGRADAVAPEDLDARLAAVDEPTAALRRASRGDDGFYSTFVLRRMSRRLTAVALRRGWTPDAVTLTSLAIGLSAAGMFAVGTRAALVAGAVLLQLSLVVDCVDGEVARYTRRFTRRGAWLDGSTDRVKEYAAFAGLAVGSARSGDDVWLLAAAALALQVVAHLGAFTWDLERAARARRTPVPRAMDDLTPGPGPAALSGVESLSARTSARPAVRWAKKVVHFPIGERWLLISVLAALGSARLVFWALLLAGAVSVAYSFAGRVLRGRAPVSASKGDPADIAAFAAVLDLGPIGRAVGRAVPSAGARHSTAVLLLAAAAVAAGVLVGWPGGVGAGAVAPALVGFALVTAATLGAGGLPPAGAYRWLPPAVLRSVEYGVIIALVAWVLPDAPWAAFAVLLPLCLLHYDVTYRQRVLRSAPPRWLQTLTLGYDGRLLVLAVVLLAGAAALRGWLLALAVWCTLLWAAAIVDWLRRTREGRDRG